MEDNSVTNILLMNKENCALKLVDEITWTVVLFNLCVGRCFAGYLSYSVLLKELNFLRNS